MTSTALHTDRYELTMIDAALRAGVAERPAVFELFARRLPDGRRYGVVAGIGRLLDAIHDFRFTADELGWLKRNNVVSAEGLDWLEAYQFSGNIRGYREGELYFPGSPLLVVESGFAQGVVIETLALSILNYDTAVASAAARMVSAAQGRPLSEMGSRRTGEHSAIAAARAAYIAGFAATSNLEAGRRWGVPTMGTAAHAFTLLFPTEEEAFAAQVASLGPETTLLVDTYDIRQGVENAVRAAGTRLGAVRIDSGDLGVVVRDVRRQLDRLGATDTRITVTNDLDEHAIAALASAPVDAYGVGTSLVTGSGAPAAGMVYKLVARHDPDGTWKSVGKTSEGKATVGGRKHPVRALRDGTATSEDIHIDAAPTGITPETGRALHTELVRHGAPEPTALGPEGVTNAREHHARAITELPDDARRLSRGEPAIPTRYIEQGTPSGS
ncbi:nicotinate phosphoribosyltransferase [Homoserinibacter sp. GY 40078]|uniref:nicotinate phosphoribosyltransferase n=1 Tax=Homoserinibacter sp. GY 40078 TaxID=2603275 RepID=UPI0011CA0593|nr:nicotinate phosphoribosyltransferase [Homoserinibacter sp. GY 40078]TXK17133.1 nicotinate phosphoribosyltransferase [Homoserinibacter sp. GY 40078]